MIGLDIDKDQIRVVELKDSSAGLTLTKFAAENAASRTIAEVFAQLQIEEKEVCTAISGPGVQIRRISLPPMPAEELSQAVKWEAKNFVPFSIETASLDYYPLKDAGKGGKLELMVVAVDGEALKSHLETVKGAGLKCAAVTAVPFALREIVKLHPEFSAGGLAALVCIREETTCLNLFKKNELIFTRDLDFSGETLRAAPADAPAVFGKLQNELTSSFEYFRDQFPEEKITQIFLSGESAKAENLKEYLGVNLGLPVETLDPLKNLKIDPKVDESELKEAAQRLILPICLALGKGKEQNLLKIKAREGAKKVDLIKALDYVRIPNLAIVGLLLVFLSLIFGLNFYLNYSILKIKKDLDIKTAKLSQLVKLRDRKFAFEEITKKETDVKLLLARINALMPLGLSLVDMTFDNDKKEINLSGESEDPKIASSFLKRVEESPSFTATRLIEIAKAGETTTFKVSFNAR